MLRERDVGLAKSRLTSSFSTGPTAGTLVRVPSPNRRSERTPAADARILHFDNHSDTEPMVFVAFYLLNGEQKLIEMLDA